MEGFFIAQLCPDCRRDMAIGDVLHEFGPNRCHRCGAELPGEDRGVPVIVVGGEGTYRVEAFPVPIPVEALWDPVDDFFVARLCSKCHHSIEVNDVLYEYGPDWCQRCGARLHDEDVMLVLLRVVYVGGHIAYVDRIYPPGALVYDAPREGWREGDTDDATLYLCEKCSRALKPGHTVQDRAGRCHRCGKRLEPGEAVPRGVRLTYMGGLTFRVDALYPIT